MRSETSLTSSDARDRFLRTRDNALERDAVEKLRPFLSAKARVWTKLYESVDCQYEHDVIAVDDGLSIVLEAKASPPIEPFRDPDRAFVRLKDAFRGDTGIQKAHEQAERIVSQLRSGRSVTLFDASGHEVTRLVPDASMLSIGICLTRDNFAGLATNLALLLEKDADTPYPWVVHSLDLENMGEAWRYLGWGPADSASFLSRESCCTGKCYPTTN